MRNNIFHQISKIFYIAVFIMVITIPLLLTLFNNNNSINIENRENSKTPPIELIKNGQLGKYMQLLQDYFNDNYTLKSRLISFNSFIDYNIFKLSPKDSVIIGKDNWLFYTAEDGVNMSDYYGKNLFSEGELEDISVKMKDINKQLEKKDIEFIVMMAPNKHTIYEEYLPERVAKLKGNKTRADQYSPLLNTMEFKYIDLRDKLFKAKESSNELLYYPLDSHWNDLAGKIAYKELVENLEEKPKNTSILPEVKIGERNRTGDLGNLIGLSYMLKDTNIYADNQNTYTSSEIKNKNIDQTTTVNPKGDKRKVLVFKDSFIGAIIPFLSSDFSEVIYSASPIVDFELISQHKPDIVVLQFVERYSNILLQNGDKF